MISKMTMKIVGIDKQQYEKFLNGEIEEVKLELGEVTSVECDNPSKNVHILRDPETGNIHWRTTDKK